jgi:SAM-dependent methyltransferase
MKKLFLVLWISCLFINLYSNEGTSNNSSEVEKWSEFIEKLYRMTEGKIIKPFCPVDTLIKKYLCQTESTRPVLDIGCETGKNAICLIQAGHSVLLLDIAPNAIQYTQENLKKLGLSHGIFDSINGNIETLDSKYGPFKAVVGTYVFSFIPPETFQQVMRENVLDRVESGGYFAGGFFGVEHAWAEKPNLSIVTREQLERLFASMEFSICEIDEKKEEILTVSSGIQVFHTIEVIAQRH